MKALSCRTTATSMLKKNGLALFVGIALSSSVYAQDTSERTQYAISSGDLVKVVNEISRNSGLQIVYNIDDLKGIRAAAVKGELTVQQALDKALRSTNLSWTQVNPTTISIKKKAQAPQRPSQEGTNVKPPSASSTAVDPSASVQELEKMVVVGSRLGVSPIDSAMPIQVISREQIDRSGSGNIAQVLSYLSEVSVNSTGDRPIGVGDGLADGSNTNSTTVQMRGMPRGTTLILINGRKAGDSATYSDTGQFDLSAIPLSLVERIEVLPSGSSAIYGGDGLAGVVNIILRRDASGAELRYRTAFADGYVTRQASAMWGRTWEGADFTVAATWGEDGALYSSERSLTASQDYSRFGGPNLQSSRGNPATVYSLVGCPVAPSTCRVPLVSRGNLPGLGSPVAVVPAGSSGVGLTPADFIATQGQENRTSNLLHLRSPEKRHGITMTGRKELIGSVEMFGDFNYSHREVPAYQVQLGASNGMNGARYARLPATNPFNPFGVDVSVGYNFTSTGIFSTYEQKFMRGAVGVRGKQKYFDWEISGWQSRDEAITGGSSYFDTNLIIAALNSTDPATAFNPFVTGSGLPVSREILESFAVDLSGKARSRTTGVTAFARGQPLQLPAGKVTSLIGVEHQKQQYDILSNSTALTAPEASGSTKSTAYFAEARIPLVAPREGSVRDTVALTGAMRRETSDRYESSATTETVGLEFRPAESILLRSTYSTAFRPLINYYAVLPTRYREQTVYDPIEEQSYNVIVRSGGGAPADLEPEKSRNSTFGLVFRPDSNLSLSVTYWNMKFRDRISYTSVQTIVDEERLRPARIQRDPGTNEIQEVDARQINVAMISSSGVDVGFDKTWDTPIGELRTSLAATYTSKYEQQSTPDAPVQDRLAKLNSEGWAPKWKIVPRVGWDGEKVRTMLTGRYVSQYEDSELFVSGPRQGQANYLGEFWLVDLNVDLQVGKFLSSSSRFSEMSLNLGATNLFNRLPEYCVGCYLAGYDASQYDIMGRTVYAELRMQF